MLQKLKNIDNTWFFSRPPWWARMLTIYVKGDAIILSFFWIGLIICAFFNLKWSAVALLIFLFLRSFTEINYWLFQQFSSREYRPEDFDFPRLDNHAIYILFQILNLLYCTIYATVLVYLVKNV